MSGAVDYLLFARDSRADAAPAAPAGYRFEAWTPALRRVRPAVLPRVPFSLWWAFHELSVFRNRDYAVLLGWYGDSLAHYLAIVPGYFRFPFVGRDDLQIAVVWTHPDHRGRGIATFAIQTAMHFRRAAGRRFWYMSAEDNTASARTARRAGLSLVGRARRTSRLGVRLLGAYEPEPGSA